MAVTLGIVRWPALKSIAWHEGAERSCPPRSAKAPASPSSAEAPRECLAFAAVGVGADDEQVRRRRRRRLIPEQGIDLVASPSAEEFAAYLRKQIDEFAILARQAGMTAK